MCWMIRCVTSARARAAGGSLPHSSVPTSPVCSTTVNTAGPASTPEPAASSTNRWWRREATALGTSRSAGAEPLADPATSTGIDHKEEERALPQGSRCSGNLCIRSRFLKKKWVFLLLLLLSFTVMLLNSASSITQNRSVWRYPFALWLTTCLLGTLISYTWSVTSTVRRLPFSSAAVRLTSVTLFDVVLLSIWLVWNWSMHLFSET